MGTLTVTQKRILRLRDKISPLQNELTSLLADNSASCEHPVTRVIEGRDYNVSLLNPPRYNATQCIFCNAIDRFNIGNWKNA